MIARAFSPGNITLFFGIYNDENPLKSGSIGVSFATTKGAFATAQQAEHKQLIINDKEAKFPTVETAIQLLTDQPVKIEIKTELPIGHGYSMSASCTLAALLATNQVLNINKTKKQLALIAHQSEVINNTGLGSITAEYLGGILSRRARAEPLEAKELNVEHKVLYYRTLGPILTKEVITNPEMKTRINLACSKAIKGISTPSLEQLFHLGKTFALETGLLQDPELIQLIEQVESEGGAATMNMVGKSIIATKPFPGSAPIQIAKQGATLLT
ncbi:MAG: hypothetical protein O2779_04780 [Nanoarchaeota archaeon]|nr:hypothetical protein [Nanoarchaeota archaeon]